MIPRLSVVIATINDPEIESTIRSIRETAGDKPEILIVDDCSASKLTLEDKNVTLIHNRFRCGVGPSRHLGVLAATGSHVLITDAHVRFTPGWYEAAMERIADRPTTLHCGTCLALDDNHMDINNPVSVYNGATFNFFGPDRVKPGTQILEGTWIEDRPGEDDYEIPCVMGAAYFWPRDWFLKLSPLNNLKSWGGDEVIMSLKAWLSGGDIRMMKTVRIGHKFRLKHERLPFVIPTPHVIFNKLFTIFTCLAEPYSTALVNKFQQGIDFNTAKVIMKDHWNLIAIEQNRNRELFTIEFPWLLERFALTCPK